MAAASSSTGDRGPSPSRPCDDHVTHRLPPCRGRDGPTPRPHRPTTAQVYRAGGRVRRFARPIPFRSSGKPGTIRGSGRAGRRSPAPRRPPTGGTRMIVLIDNYDSFTYNLVQRLGEIDPSARPARRPQRPDHASTRSRRSTRRHLIISPGPCTPREAGISNAVVERFAPTIPLLGVCLGHQCIGHTFGGEVVRADRIMHGKTSLIHHDGQGIYRGPAQPVRGDPLPQPGDPARHPARRVRGRRLDRPGRDHGRPPQDVAAGRRPVPSRELPDARRDQAAEELHRALSRRDGRIAC